MKINKDNNQKNTKDENFKSGKFAGFYQWFKSTFLLILYDLLVINGAYLFALWIRFDCRFNDIPVEYITSWLAFVPFYSVFTVSVFGLLHLYRSLWRFASFDELKRILLSSVITSAFHIIGITLVFERMPISYYFIGSFVQFFLVFAIRFLYRFVLLERKKLKKALDRASASRVMLIGAGSAGQMILRDLHNADEVNEWVYCIIDDNSSKWGKYIDGVPIVGGRDDILLNVEKFKIKKIFLAIPSASAEERRDVLDICKETNCELKNLPGMYQFVTGDMTVNAMKQVDTEDLLGREAVKVNMDEIYSSLTNKVVLVTGGGGSIGSELCRQIAKNSPKQLIIFDIYENNAYSIQLELKDLYKELNLEVLIGSVRDTARINDVFAKYKPEIVFHAAAHKHVPLMEDSPCESIKNNAIGTYKTAYAAMMNNCKRFVLISTDKAVNPTNIMGASKRICEMVIQSFDRKIKDGKAFEIAPLSVHGHQETPNETDTYPQTEFVAVRFGNVLGSNGSVIPLFKKQIANGGPVTVTHPDIIRYFMTIPEAASLVLQAGTYAAGGEIFVLDMGAPVKIDTLARNLIRLSGLKPNIDIEISYTGLRPGEKLFEEKLMSEEGMRTTPNHLIHIGNPIAFDTDSFLNELKELTDIAYSEDERTTRNLVKKIVPTYCPSDVEAENEKVKEMLNVK